MHPMTVRQVFYQAMMRDIVERTETDLATIRRAKLSESQRS